MGTPMDWTSYGVDYEQPRMISERLTECSEFYLGNGVAFPNMREALAMDYREFYIEHWGDWWQVAEDEPDWQELTDVWLASNFSQQELEGEY